MPPIRIVTRAEATLILQDMGYRFVTQKTGRLYFERPKAIDEPVVLDFDDEEAIPSFVLFGVLGGQRVDTHDFGVRVRRNG